MIEGFIVTVIVGAICILLGVSNMKGNISSLHSYHRNRVSEEDRIPFGKMVGKGMIIIGISVIAQGISFLMAEFLKNEAITLVGAIVMIIGMAIGMGISFYAMIKYNKGIF